MSKFKYISFKHTPLVIIFASGVLFSATEDLQDPFNASSNPSAVSYYGTTMAKGIKCYLFNTIPAPIASDCTTGGIGDPTKASGLLEVTIGGTTSTVCCENLN